MRFFGYCRKDEFVEAVLRVYSFGVSRYYANKR
jgi:hypothetical protein